MILRIKELVPANEIGLEFYFQIPKVIDGTEWLMTNGFRHHATQSTKTDYWTRDGDSAITFKKGIIKDGPIVRAGASRTLRADFIHEVALKDVICEDVH